MLKRLLAIGALLLAISSAAQPKPVNVNEKMPVLATLLHVWYGINENTGECDSLPRQGSFWADKYHTGIHGHMGNASVPLLGFYCSRDTETIDAQIALMREAGIGLVIIAWHGWGDNFMGHSAPDTELYVPSKVWSRSSADLQYVDETEDSASDNPDDIRLVPIQVSVTDDALFVGWSFKFDRIRFRVTRAGSYSGISLLFRYWNGSAWAPLTVTDNTSGFTKVGDWDITFTPPADWKPINENGFLAYYVMIVASHGVAPSITQAPLGGRIWVSGTPLSLQQVCRKVRMKPPGRGFAV